MIVQCDHTRTVPVLKPPCKGQSWSVFVCRSGIDCESHDGCASTYSWNQVVADTFSWAQCCPCKTCRLAVRICKQSTTHIGASKTLTCLVNVGVGGGSSRQGTLVLAGAAGLVGGALSMAVGEYISVSSQRDAERADVQRERDEQAKGANMHSPYFI